MDLSLCIDAQIEERQSEGDKCPENSPKQTDWLEILTITSKQTGKSLTHWS